MRVNTSFPQRRLLKSLICCSVLGVCSSLVVSTASAITLQNAVHQTLTTHPDILSAKSAETAARHDVRQAQGGFLPSVDLEAGIGKEYSNNPATRAAIRQDTRTLTRQESALRASQLLFDGGNVKNTVAQRRADFLTRHHQVSESQDALAFDAADAYLNVIRQREIVRIRKSDVAAHIETLAKVRKRLKAGAGRKSELDLVDSRLALSRARLTRAQGDLRDSYDTYYKVIGTRVPDHLVVPTLPTTPVTLTAAQHTAMGINPSVAALESQVDANTAAIGVARSAYFPTFTVDAGGTAQNDLDGVKGHNNDAELMVRMRYNLFNGGSDKAAIDSAIARETEARHDLDNIRRDVAEDVALSWNNLQASIKRLPNLRIHRDQSRNVFIAYGKQFQLGQRTLFDLLNAETEYIDAKASLTDGIYDVRSGTYRLLASTGTIIPKMFGNNQTVRTNLPRVYGAKGKGGKQIAQSKGMKNIPADKDVSLADFITVPSNGKKSSTKLAANHHSSGADANASKGHGKGKSSQNAKKNSKAKQA